MTISHSVENVLGYAFDYIASAVDYYGVFTESMIPRYKWTTDHVYVAFNHVINLVFASQVPSMDINYMQENQHKRINRLMQLLGALLSIENILEFIENGTTPPSAPENVANLCMEFCHIIIMLQVCTYDGKGSFMLTFNMPLMHEHECIRIPNDIWSYNAYLDTIELSSEHALNILYNKLMRLRMPGFPIMYSEFVYGANEGDPKYYYCDTIIYSRMVCECRRGTIVIITRDPAEESGSDG